MAEQEIKITLDEKTSAGVYANAALISHNENEFVMDFMFVHPPAGKVNSRVIMSPAHVKRFLTALEQNVKMFESNLGTIKEIKDTPDFRINLSNN